MVDGALRRPSGIGWGLAMSAWKRWSWRYRVGALFALALLLQGASCPLDLFSRPTFFVPTSSDGDGLRVIGELFTDEKGDHYYLVETIGPGGARGFRRVYPGSLDYIRISWWWPTVVGQNNRPPDRSSIPGGSGMMPNPPVQ